MAGGGDVVGQIGRQLPRHVAPRGRGRQRRGVEGRYVVGTGQIRLPPADRARRQGLQRRLGGGKAAEKRANRPGCGPGRGL